VVWRRKLLSFQDSVNLQSYFADFQIAMGSPANLAMFTSSQAGDEKSMTYITGPQIAAVEGESPGGWEDCGPPAGPNVALLIGEGDPWVYFGIPKPFS